MCTKINFKNFFKYIIVFASLILLAYISTNNTKNFIISIIIIAVFITIAHILNTYNSQNKIKPRLLQILIVTLSLSFVWLINIFFAEKLSYIGTVGVLIGIYFAKKFKEECD